MEIRRILHSAHPPCPGEWQWNTKDGMDNKGFKHGGPWTVEFMRLSYTNLCQRNEKQARTSVIETSGRRSPGLGFYSNLAIILSSPNSELAWWTLSAPCPTKTQSLKVKSKTHTARDPRSTPNDSCLRLRIHVKKHRPSSGGNPRWMKLMDCLQQWIFKYTPRAKVQN